MTTSTLRIAILQERFGTGGRERVVAVMVEVLNSMGIIPDVITMRSTMTPAEIQRLFGMEVKYRVRELPKLLPHWLSGAEALYTNILGNFWGRKRDAIVNMNSSMAFCGSSTPTFFYFTMPERHLVLSQKADSGSGLLRYWRQKIHQFLVRAFDVPKKNFLIACLCESTREALQQAYPDLAVRVVYPPIDIRTFTNSREKSKIIVNIGRYSVEKRQLDFIAQARSLPQYRLVCIGSGQQGEYFERCVQYVKDQELINVELRGAVSLSELRSTLEEAMFYVHMFRFEPFGMATAEAIAAGCIPVVPDSWGNREIVIKPELRFRRDAEIVTIIHSLERDPARMEHYRADLSKHVERFDKAVFKVEFEKLLRDLVDRGRS